MKTIGWDQFEQVDLRVGTVLEAAVFPEARIPAYRVVVDFGPDIGVKKTSARITDLYTPEELTGRQVIGVVNFPPKQIGPMMSEFLIAGFYRDDGAVVLAIPDKSIENGAKLA